MTDSRRVILIVLDSVGCGALPDAAKFGDEGSHTLGNMSRAVKGLKLPNLQRLGLGNVFEEKEVLGLERISSPKGSYGKLMEVSLGKDTSTGHFEMAGCIVSPPFPTFPEGFNTSWLEKICADFGIAGYLANSVASGTEIIDQLGEEHIKTGLPIIYTSADSVFQVAAHEKYFGLQKLLDFCEHARKYCDSLNIARVIARPFVGEPGSFQRTSNRKDFAIPPWQPTMMEKIRKKKLPVVGVGKIGNIYDHVGISDEIHTKDNLEGIEKLLQAMDDFPSGLLFCNLVDFDMLYGHRRNPVGYYHCLRQFDDHLPRFLNRMKDDDLLILVSDHGNDPTFKGTDHTREYCLLLTYTSDEKSADLGIRKSLADVGQTIVDFLGAEKLGAGESFASLISKAQS